MNFYALTFFIVFNISFFYLLNMKNGVTYVGSSDTGVGSKPKKKYKDLNTYEQEIRDEEIIDGVYESKNYKHFTEQEKIEFKKQQKKYSKAQKRYNRNLKINLIIYVFLIYASFIINTYIVYKFFDLNIDIRSTLQNTLMLLAISMVIILIIIMSISDITINDLIPDIDYSYAISIFVLFFTCLLQIYYFYYNKNKITNLSVLAINILLVTPFLYYLNIYLYKNIDNNIIDLTDIDYGTRKLNTKQTINDKNNHNLEKFGIYFSLYVESGQKHDNYSYTEILNFGEANNNKKIDFCKLTLDHINEELVLYILKDINDAGINFDNPRTDTEMNIMDSYYLKFTTPINMFYKWNDIQIKYNGTTIYVYINNLLVIQQPYYITINNDIYINKIIVGDDRVTSMPGLIKDAIFIKQ